MGAKTRGNYHINFCIKTDCINRDKYCKHCIKFNLYMIDLDPKYAKLINDNFWELVKEEKKNV